MKGFRLKDSILNRHKTHKKYKKYQEFEKNGY